MPYYVDTSAFIKLVVAEEHSDALRSWVEDHDPELFGSDLLRTEALRTARRHSSEAVQEARSRLEAVTIFRLTRDICEHAAHLDPEILRTLDALHLAAALAGGEELEGIVTYDDRVTAAARLYGIESVMPGRRV